jgi:hypothetical protein
MSRPARWRFLRSRPPRRRRERPHVNDAGAVFRSRSTRRSRLLTHSVQPVRRRTSSASTRAQISDALAAHLDDTHFDARHEALFGLASRSDQRALASALRKLTAESVGTLAVRAAALLGNVRLLPALIELRGLVGLATRLA